MRMHRNGHEVSEGAAGGAMASSRGTRVFTVHAGEVGLAADRANACHHAAPPPGPPRFLANNTLPGRRTRASFHPMSMNASAYAVSRRFFRNRAHREVSAH